jgi:membrane glycosyltransferase
MKNSTRYSVIKIFVTVLFCWVILPFGTSIWGFILLPFCLQIFGILAVLQDHARQKENEKNI